MNAANSSGVLISTSVRRSKRVHGVLLVWPSFSRSSTTHAQYVKSAPLAGGRGERAMMRAKVEPGGQDGEQFGPAPRGVRCGGRRCGGARRDAGDGASG